MVLKKWLFFLFPLMILGCNFDLNHTEKLGRGYFFVSDGGVQTVIIKSKTDDYNGGGKIIVPMSVYSFDYNDSFIIAKVEELDQNFTPNGVFSYWIVEKVTGEVYSNLSYSQYLTQISKLGLPKQLKLD